MDEALHFALEPRDIDVHEHSGGEGERGARYSALPPREKGMHRSTVDSVSCESGVGRTHALDDGRCRLSFLPFFSPPSRAAFPRGDDEKFYLRGFSFV